MQNILTTLLPFLQTEYYGNSLEAYLIAFGILLLYFPIIFIIKQIFFRTLDNLFQKTKLRFDDIFLASLKPTVDLFIFATIFFISVSTLNFTELPTVDLVLMKIINVLYLLPIIYFMIRFSTEALGYYLKKGSSKVDETAIDVLIRIIRLILITIGILVFIENILGYDLGPLIASLGIGGLAVALAAQDVLKNLLGGISIIMDHTFKKGDRINYDDVSGIVEEVKLRTTKIKTYDGSITTVPNSKLADGNIENVSRVKTVKVPFTLGLTYDTTTSQLKKAKQLIEDILAKHKHVQSYWVFFSNFGPYTLDLQGAFYLKYTMSDWPDRKIAAEEVYFSIKEAFEKHNIEFAFPTQTIYTKKG